MNVWLKEKWLKNLIFTGVCATLSNCSVSPQASQLQQPNKVTQSKPAIENSSVKLASATLSKSEEDYFPSSAEILLLIITPEEIQLREQQAQLLQEWKRLSRLKFQAGTGTQEEMSEVVYISYHKKIELLQAKNLLQLKEQKSTLSRQPSHLRQANLADSNAFFSEVSQSKPIMENLSVKLVSATLSESQEYSFPSSAEILLLIITPEEIQLREQQAQLLQEW
ncbi:MAG: hypothetical protein ACRC80_15185, partial [Waterburya sp.]